LDGEKVGRGCFMDSWKGRNLEEPLYLLSDGEMLGRAVLHFAGREEA
jgi:hypothetical protein